MFTTLQPISINSASIFIVNDVLNEIKAFAKELPYVKEEDKATTYKVGPKTFLIIDEELSTIAVQATQKKQKLYLAGGGFTEPETLDKKQFWVSTSVSHRTDMKLLKELVLDSFHLAANKKARNKLYTEYPL